MGSTRVALHAGIAVAGKIATTTSSAGTAANVAKSCSRSTSNRKTPHYPAVSCCRAHFGPGKILNSQSAIPWRTTRKTDNIQAVRLSVASYSDIVRALCHQMRHDAV